MKRLCYFIAVMALSSSAHAGDFSFVVAGHRVHIEAPRRCRSASCVSVSIPGIYRSKRWRDRDEEVAASPEPAPVNLPAPVAAAAAPAVTRASPSPVQPVASVTPPQPPAPPPAAPAPQPASTTAKIVVLPAPPVPAAPAVSTTQTITPPPLPKTEPVKTTPAEPPVVAAKPIPVPTPLPQITKVSLETEDEPADRPLGDWQTEGNKGTVRIERCGEAMCGYLLNLTTNAKGDTILINMKPKSTMKSNMKSDMKSNMKSDTKSEAVWSGSIYSRSSGDTYYATMTMKGTNTLRVEACALGHFFCSGNDWTRIEYAPKLVTDREISPRPPS
jgi:uncharacterized protein (DUF2147 family)